MIQQHIINWRHVTEMVHTIQTNYEGGFSNPNFNCDMGVSCKTEEEYLSFLENLTNKENIIKHILEYVVGFGIFKAERFRRGDEILYVHKNLEVNLTEEYLDTYFRYFEENPIFD